MGAKEDFDMLSEIAQRMFGDDQESGERYVHESMKRLGYKARAFWEDPEPDGKEDGVGSIFGGSRQRREVGPQRRASGGNSIYS